MNSCKTVEGTMKVFFVCREDEDNGRLTIRINTTDPNVPFKKIIGKWPQRDQSLFSTILYLVWHFELLIGGTSYCMDASKGPVIIATTWCWVRHFELHIWGTIYHCKKTSKGPVFIVTHFYIWPLAVNIYDSTSCLF